MPFHRPTLALTFFALALTISHAQVESNLPGAGFDTPDIPASAAPTIQVYSRETVVDVLVTDDKGQPVRGLTRSDFTVEEDTKPQPIRSFYEYSKDAPAPTRALPPNTYSNARILPAAGPAQVFYFDLPLGSSYPPGTDEVADTAQGTIFVRAKKYIADYLRTMPVGTQVAVFAYRSDYGLRLLQGFTTDGQRAATAVDNLVVLSVGKPPSADPIAAADQIAAYVAGIHGRKNLIWIGTPLAIMRDGGYSWAVSKAPDLIYTHRLMDTYDTFTREQIAVYPFDPSGVTRIGFGSLRAEDIATETGGAAIYNTNDFKGAVAKIVNDTSHFYTLSYIPPRPNDDGHFHAIKISVDRPGVHLVYRGGYNDEHLAPPDAILKLRMTQDSMGLGALPATQLVFDLQVTSSPAPASTTAATRTPVHRALPVPGKTHVSYDLLFKLSQTQITFAVTPDGMRNATLEFDLAAYDPDAKVIAIRSQTLKLPLTPEEYQEFIQTPFQFYLSIGLPPGPTTLRAGVFDAVSNKTGTLEIPLTVPKSPPTQVAP
jgi:VWFA-related protein